MTWTMRRPLSRVGRTVPSSKFSITGIYPKCYPSFSGAVPSSKQSITGISSFFFLNQFHPGTSQPSIAEGSSESETKKRRMRRRPLRPKQRQSRRERLQSLKPRLPWTTQERMMGMMRRRRSIRMMMRSMMKMNTPLLSRRTWRMMSGARVGTRRRHGIRMKDATLAFRVRGAAADSCEWLHQCGFEVSCLGVRVSQHD